MALGAFAITACDDLAGCENEAVVEAPSPDGALKAVLFQRSCGATTGFTSQISILQRDGKLSGGGNTFVADTDHGKARAGAWGGPDVHVEWQASNQLLVTYAEKARVFKREAESAGVSITYRSSSQ